MYEKLNITENYLRILSLFTKGFNREYYIREVQKSLKISPRTAQIILDDLEKKAVLESSKKGKIKTYKIKNSFIAKEYLIFVEQYKKIAFLKSRPMIKEIISKITSHISGIGIVFGSYAKGTEKKGSDLDIFIAGKYDEKEIMQVSELYGIEISVKSYPIKTFERNIKTDTLIKEVLGSHVMISGSESLVRMALKNG